MVDECKYALLALKTRFIYNRREAVGEMMAAPEGQFCDLAVVAFNNAKVIEYQIRCLKRFFNFPYRYTVFDNSGKEK